MKSRTAKRPIGKRPITAIQLQVYHKFILVDVARAAGSEHINDPKVYQHVTPETVRRLAELAERIARGEITHVD